MYRHDGLGGRWKQARTLRCVRRARYSWSVSYALQGLEGASQEESCLLYIPNYNPLGDFINGAGVPRGGGGGDGECNLSP